MKQTKLKIRLRRFWKLFRLPLLCFLLFGVGSVLGFLCSKPEPKAQRDRQETLVTRSSSPKAKVSMSETQPTSRKTPAVSSSTKENVATAESSEMTHTTAQILDEPIAVVPQISSSQETQEEQETQSNTEFEKTKQSIEVEQIKQSLEKEGYSVNIIQQSK